MTQFPAQDPNAAGLHRAETSGQPYPAQGPPPQGQPGEFNDDAAAAMAARRELGPEYDDAIAAGLADRVEQIVAARASQPAQQIQPYRATPPEQEGKEIEEKSTSSNQSFVLGIASLGAGIPITAIAAEQGGLPGLIVAWAGIVGVNVANALTQRRLRRGHDYR